MGMDGVEEGEVGDEDFAGGSEYGEVSEGALHVADLIVGR